MQEKADINEILAQAEALRAGPRPLPVHVMTAIAEYAKNGIAPEDAVQDMFAMLQGIKYYQAHPYKRSLPDLPVVWQAGAARLLESRPLDAKETGALFIVPSMINRSDILDLTTEKSFVRWLTAQGLRVYLLDWGDAARDSGMTSMDDVIRDRLLPALSFARGAMQGNLHALGYCMGGTLLAGAASLQPDLCDSIIFLASPWDFHAGDKALAQHVQWGSQSALGMIEATGALPVDWIQSVFAAVNADRTVKKFSGFSRMDQDCAEAALYVAVEDWLNNGVDLPGGVARTCILDWYGANKPVKKEWFIDGKAVLLEKLRMPVLIVASAHDRLVPRESSLAMKACLPHCDVQEPAIGHIGMMSGRRAETLVWQPLMTWLRKNP